MAFSAGRPSTMSTVDNATSPRCNGTGGRLDTICPPHAGSRFVLRGSEAISRRGRKSKRKTRKKSKRKIQQRTSHTNSLRKKQGEAIEQRCPWFDRLRLVLLCTTPTLRNFHSTHRYSTVTCYQTVVAYDLFAHQ